MGCAAIYDDWYETLTADEQEEESRRIEANQDARQLEYEKGGARLNAETKAAEAFATVFNETGCPFRTAAAYAAAFATAYASEMAAGDADEAAEHASDRAEDENDPDNERTRADAYAEARASKYDTAFDAYYAEVRDEAYEKAFDEAGGNDDDDVDVQEELQGLHDSCIMAVNGHWDITNTEYAESGFVAMRESIEKIAAKLGLSLNGYSPERYGFENDGGQDGDDDEEDD